MKNLQFVPDYDKPCQKYSECCGATMSGEDEDHQRCPDCHESCDGVEWLDAPTPEEIDEVV